MSHFIIREKTSVEVFFSEEEKGVVQGISFETEIEEEKDLKFI